MLNIFKSNTFSKIILYGILVVVNINAQVLTKNSYKLKTSPQIIEPGLLGNGIVDILSQDTVLWIATGYGLNKTVSAGDNWVNYTSRNYVGKGGVTAMTLMDDSTLWIATSFDTTTDDEGNLPAGSGLSYTRDNGQNWFHVPQPVDSRDETEYKPTTTNIQNLTFDIAALDSTIWIASFAPYWCTVLASSLKPGIRLSS